MGQSQGVVSSLGGSGNPGTTFTSPLTLALAPGASADALTFGVQIVPVGPVGSTPPALGAGALSFIADAGFPAPTFADTGIAGSISLGWVGTISPPATGTRTLGILQVAVPSGAHAGQKYVIRITPPTASVGTTVVNLAAGPDATVTVGQAASTLTIVSGNAQSGSAGSSLAEALVVAVRDTWDIGVAGVTVTLAVVAGGGTLSATSILTDANGRAATMLTLGTTAGANVNRVTASAMGLPPVTFVATTTAGPPAALAAVSGNNQSATIGTAITNPLVVKVADSYGNGVPRATVKFRLVRGGGSVPNSVVTADNGQASATWTLGNQPGSNQVVASVDGIRDTVSFDATATGITLAVSPASIAESVVTPSISVIQRRVTVTVTPSTAAPVSYAVTVSGGAWLTASTSGAVPSTVDIAIDPTGLAASSYSGIVTISSPAAEKPVTVTVALTVTSLPLEPKLSALPKALTFVAVEGGSNPDAQSVFVTNAGTGTLTWNLSMSGGVWLSISGASGKTPSSFLVTVNGSNLQHGTYQASITITAGTLSDTIAVTLLVQPAPSVADLALSPEAMVFQADADSSAILSRQVSVKNRGAGVILWSAGVDTGGADSWLSASPASGITPASLTLQVSAAGLRPGQYTAAVTLVAPGVAGRSVNVLLTVQEGPELRVTPAVLRFAGPVGSTFSFQDLRVTTSSGQNVTYSGTTEAPENRNWLLISSGGTTPGSLSTAVKPAGLTAGIYLASILISGQETRNAIRVPVVLELLAPETTPLLQVSPGGLLLVGQAGGSSVSRDVSVRGIPTRSFSWTVTRSTLDGGDWLSASAGTARGDATLTVRANPNPLGPGLYSGEVTVSSTETANRSVSVGVTLIVLPGAVTSASPRLPAGTTSAVSPARVLVTAEPARQFVVTAGIPQRVEAYLVAADGKPIAGADVRLTISSEERPLSLKDAGDGLYSGIWTPQQSGPTALRFWAPPAEDAVVSGNASASARPVAVLATGGAVNGASFAADLPLAAGSIVSVFGLNFIGRPVAASAVPLPKVLSSASLSVNGITVPLFYVSTNQINCQIPRELAGQATAAFRFASGDDVALLQDVPLAPVSPGVFLVGTAQQGAILHQDGRLADATAPAVAGEYLSIYATGLGEVTNPPTTGAPAGAAPFSETRVKPVVAIGGIPADVTFSGLAPGFVGLYQVNARVPLGFSGNAIPVTIKVGATVSNTATIAAK
jgi:adhesin/invasin